MPRLSPELRAKRRQHVLTSAWSRFAQDGFHATSMDDIIAATGISARAVYRYFPSKEELIDAAADEALALLRDLFTRLLESEPAPTPAETITALVDELSQRSANADYDLSKIAMHAWSEALRRPAVAARNRAFYRDVREHLTELARRWQAEGYLATDANPEDAASALVTLMPGLIVHQHLVDPVSADTLISGFASMSAAATGS